MSIPVSITVLTKDITACTYDEKTGDYTLTINANASEKRATMLNVDVNTAESES